MMIEPMLRNMSDEELIHAFKESDDPVTLSFCERLSDALDFIEELQEQVDESFE